eukprot:Gregarina_sp_Poly_1__1165@NODE_1285_length_4496_cov_45_606006_g740_i1_p2_GENE_NODE_1285_length_4496_cov_45_606006_g740_i1NODE_1285_length_4496_cov_45_606006_g740_i1_p2_ORF_typecomplete_len589_score74_73DUF3657/PF12394_8/7_2e03DUF3657/PF12394_8/0_0035DUF3657/PF12394_8/1_8e04_NODE_1285_length_4496_cov_45_606006_g740_i123964162
MAFYGYLETFIHFHSLRNIDLFHQGLYQIRCHVYRECGPSEVISALPWRITTSPLECVCEHRRSGIPRDTHCLAPSFIKQSNRTFTTRTFQIRFCDEEVELNDGITFRFEVDLTKPASYTAPVYIEFQLLYAEAPSNDQLHKEKRKSEGANDSKERRHLRKKNKATSASPLAGDDFLASPLRDEQDNGDSESRGENGKSLYPYDTLNWVAAAYQIMKVKDPMMGQSSYTQATFDHLHFCVCHCTVYTALVDIRQGIRQPQVPPLLEPRHNQPKCPPSLSYATSKETAEKSTAEALLSPEQLTTPRDSAPYWMSNKGSIHDMSLLTSGGHTSLLEHLAAVIQGLHWQTTMPASASFTARRSTFDYSNTTRTATGRSSLGPGLLVPCEVEVVRIVTARADRVYREYLMLLARTYYRLRAYITTISYRCLSEKENQELTWIWMSGKQFYLPGKLTIEAKPNGLPEQSVNLSDANKLATLTFSIPAHICIDAARELFATNDLHIAGASRSISIPFYPLTSRLKSLPAQMDEPCDASLLAEIQAVFVEDLNLIWGQVHDSWQKLKVLVSLTHRGNLNICQLSRNFQRLNISIN